MSCSIYCIYVKAYISILRVWLYHPGQLDSFWFSVLWTHFVQSAISTKVWYPAPVSSWLYRHVVRRRKEEHSQVLEDGYVGLKSRLEKHAGSRLCCRFWDKWSNVLVLVILTHWRCINHESYCTCIFLTTLITLQCTEHASQDQG